SNQCDECSSDVHAPSGNGGAPTPYLAAIVEPCGGGSRTMTMLKLSRLALVACMTVGLAAPAAAQAPDPAPTPQPSPQVTPGNPDSAAAPCGQRLELFIGSVLSQLGGGNPPTRAQRPRPETFQIAAANTREDVRSALAQRSS